jgi:hypothetical protein
MRMFLTILFAFCQGCLAQFPEELLLSIRPPAAATVTLLTDLASYWKLEETVGNNREDAHSTRDATESSSGHIHRISGKVGYGAKTTNESYYLSYSSNWDWDENAAWSISIWVYVDTAAVDKYLFSTSAYGGAYLRWVSGNYLEICFYDGTWGVYRSSSLSTGWHHAAFGHYGGASGTAWVQWDGGSRDTQTKGFQENSGASKFFLIGAWGGGFGAPIMADEIGVWLRTLSTTEVSTLYNSGTGITYENF